jgi:hypothetical protein
MSGAIANWARIRLAAACFLGLSVNVALAQQPSAPPAVSGIQGVHLGVAACAGSTCHGAVERLKGSSVAQNEYITWTRRDKHAKAYSVLFDERSVRIARNLGLPNAHTAEICLNCHADNAPQDKRGRQFQLSDGVGCEACHGAASGWLGIHLSAVSHRQNLEAGLYPTEQPAARAEKCLSCHLGDSQRVITHRIMGAGHPRLGFELDTFTAVQPAHFTIDKNYIDRKGRVNGVQVWAVGQAVALVKSMDAILDPKRAPSGMWPELVLFDCQSCHHGISEARWVARPSTGLPPGSIKLYDANAVMLKIITARVAPDTSKTLSDRLLGLHKASTENWANVQREAREIRQIASTLVPVLSRHDFTRDDMRALADGLIKAGLTRDDVDYSGAEQATMAMSSIVSAMKQNGFASDSELKAMNEGMNALYEAVARSENYKPEAFIVALGEFQKTLQSR